MFLWYFVIFEYEFALRKSNGVFEIVEVEDWSSESANKLLRKGTREVNGKIRRRRWCKSVELAWDSFVGYTIVR